MLGKLQRLGRWVLRIYSIYWQVKVIALKNVAILGSGNARSNRVKFNTTSALARAKARSSHSGFCISCPLPKVKVQEKNECLGLNLIGEEFSKLGTRLSINLPSQG